MGLSASVDRCVTVQGKLHDPFQEGGCGAQKVREVWGMLGVLVWTSGLEGSVTAWKDG